MPARDFFHDLVRNALVGDGWTITDDPLHMKFGRHDMYVDLGAERLLAAQKDGRRIAVEIKSFLGNSELTDLERAVGQFVIYHCVLEKLDPERVLYLAVPKDVFKELFEDDIGKLIVESLSLHLIVFDPKSERIIEWKTSNKTEH